MTGTSIENLSDSMLARDVRNGYPNLVSLVSDAFSGSSLGLVGGILKYVRDKPFYARQLIDRETKSLQSELTRRIADYSETDPSKIFTSPVIQGMAMKLAIATTIPEIMNRLEKISEED